MADKRDIMADKRAQIKECLSRGFDSGNYANAYETTDLDSALRVRNADEWYHFRLGFVTGFFSSYELHEIPGVHRDDAIWCRDEYARLMGKDEIR